MRTTNQQKVPLQACLLREVFCWFIGRVTIWTIVHAIHYIHTGGTKLMKLSLVELKPGMVLEQAIHTDDNKCLLNSGTALTLKNIEKLKALKNVKYINLLS